MHKTPHCSPIAFSRAQYALVSEIFKYKIAFPNDLRARAREIQSLKRYATGDAPHRAAPAPLIKFDARLVFSFSFVHERMLRCARPGVSPAKPAIEIKRTAFLALLFLSFFYSLRFVLAERV